MDFLPTFVSMAGLKPPQGIDLDGRDISAVLTRDAPSPHEQILLFNNEEVAAIRMQRWKYVNETYDRGMLVNFGDKKEYLELYDMNLDVGESYSVAERHPQGMQARLQRARPVRSIQERPTSCVSENIEGNEAGLSPRQARQKAR